MEESAKTVKSELRLSAKTRRDSIPDRAILSEKILSRLKALPEFAVAKNVLVYVSAKSEVQTLPGIPAIIEAKGSVIVPFAVAERLGLFRLVELDQLEPGSYGIPEPRALLRNLAERDELIKEIDLAVLPGLAFTRAGARLGYGKGHFDRLLPDLAKDVPKVALAFSEQLVESIPTEPHDIPVDIIVTEAEVIRCRNS